MESKISYAPSAETHALLGRNGQIETVNAVMLGQATSFNPARDPAQTHWFEVDILFSEDTDEYIVCTRGMTTVPGQTTYARIMRTRSCFEVAELLMVNHNGKRYLTTPARRALAQGAEWDVALKEALAMHTQSPSAAPLALPTGEKF